MKKILFLLLIFVPILSIGQFKVPSPIPNSLIHDYTGTLTSDQKATLDTSLLQFERKSSIEVAVVIVSSLEGESIEDVAHKVFNSWGIGKRHLNNGVLYIICPNERQARIEVGSGLEGDLSDYDCNVLQEPLKEYYRSGKYYEGISVLTIGIVKKLEPISWEQRQELRKKRAEQEKKALATALNFLMWGGIIGLVILLFFLLRMFIIKARLKKEEAERARLAEEKWKKELEESRKKRKSDLIYVIQRILNWNGPSKKDIEHLENQAKVAEIIVSDFIISINASKNSLQTAQKKYTSTDLNSCSLESLEVIFRALNGPKETIQKSLEAITSNISRKKREVKQSEDLVKSLPKMKEEARLALKGTPFTAADLKEESLKKYIGAKYPFVFLASMIALEASYLQIINWKKNEADRIQREKDAAARRKREEEEAEDRRRKRREDERRNSSSNYGSSYSSGSSSSSSDSSSSSGFSFGGGGSSGGGSSSSW
jgi:uncharacterized protein